VDALLGRQSRPHDDLDLVVARADRAPALEALAPMGYRHDPQVRPGLPARLVLRDAGGRQVDVHPVHFDREGNGWQQLSVRAWGLYPAEGLRASGSIAGREVRCITPDLQLRHHLGYDWDEDDLHDMLLLASRFGL
jgi:lincosamide nucleotidyltransferase A/C/D/E